MDVTVPLQPDDQIIKAGKRLCLVVLSSDRLFTVRPEPGTRLGLDLSGCELELPVVGGAIRLEAGEAATAPAGS